MRFRASLGASLGRSSSSFQGKPQDKCSSLPRLAEKIYFTIVQLHDPERHGQTDSRTLLLGGKIELEDLVPFVRRDSLAGVRDADLGLLTADRRFEAQLAALRHGLN